MHRLWVQGPTLLIALSRVKKKKKNGSGVPTLLVILGSAHKTVPRLQPLLAGFSQPATEVGTQRRLLQRFESILQQKRDET